jgi:eukaryotic-like serine/threonine-protein kinase
MSMITNQPDGSRGDSSGSTDSASLGVQLARELRRLWRHGARPMAEELLNQHAELRQSPEAAIDVIYEEYCLRQSAGEIDADQDILRRFPQWREPLQVMLECHRVLQPSGVVPDFPTVGDTVSGFRLVEVLGRGARGRVYLATQTDLASRPVVLKFTPLDGAEHLSLARLQHTNIVPVYSVAHDEERHIRVLCMPYFGRTTLAAVLKSLANVPLTARTGHHIASAIDERHESSPELAHSAARQMLVHVSYVQAACWITACLADALQYAHEHSLVHLDVKPSNVLLASDGQPMLLDFHLAREPLRHPGLLPDHFGGTPAYMPPEQRAAMQALSSGVPVEQTVDGRADIYALGAILYELLGGRLPVAAECHGGVSSATEKSQHDPERLTVPRRSKAVPVFCEAAPSVAESAIHRLSEINPQVSAGLADIVAKCLAPQANNRYANAAALADDLRRHLTDLPLSGAPNRSLSERCRKWRRRQRNTVRAAGTVAVMTTAAALALTVAWSHVRQLSREADRSLIQGQAQLQGNRPAEAVATFEHGLSLIKNVPFRRDLAGLLREQLATARQLRLAGQLHQLADKIRSLYGTSATSALSPGHLDPLARLCRQFWQERQQIAQSFDTQRDSAVAIDLLDVAIFGADLQVQLAPEVERGAARREALRTLADAEAMFGQSAVLDYQRHVYQGNRDAGGTDPLPLPVRRTAWEHYALGRALLNSNHLSRAAEELNAAVALDPAGLWPNFYFGLCVGRMGRHDEAVAAFSVCIGAAPTLAGCYYNRAAAHTALAHTDQALRDYNRALELEPTLAAAWLNRGLLHYELGQYPVAVADLRRALGHGAHATTVHYDLALVYLAAHDVAAAQDSLRRALADDPAHKLAQRLSKTLLTTDAELPDQH